MKKPLPSWWVTLMGVFLAGWGAFHHLALGMAWKDPLLVGDRGDGFFNFFVLEHVRRVMSGQLADLSNARIFWPDHAHSFWWSDNLLIPGVLHRIFTAMTGAPEVSAHLSVVFWSLLGFAACWWLFSEIMKTAENGVQDRLEFFWKFTPPVLAYLCAFSISRMHSISHFQNLSGGVLVLQITFLFRHLRTPTWQNLTGIAASQCALFYFSPYQALLGVVLLSAWAFCQLITCSVPRLKQLLLHAVGAIPFLAASGWIVLQYSKVEPRTYDVVEFSSRAARMGNYLRPLGRAVDSDVLPTSFPGGYLGLGLILATALCFSGLMWLGWRNRKRIFSQRVFWCWLVLLGCSFIDSREVRSITVWLRLIALLFPLFWIGRTVRKIDVDRERLPWVFLGLSCILVFGVTLGPVMYFQNQPLDPGIWGWYHHLLPGFASMRELMRFTPTVQLLLTACIFALLVFRYRPCGWILGIGGVCVLLQAVEMRQASPKSIQASEIPPLTVREANRLEELEGSILALPCGPFHENTRWILRFQEYPNLILVNGYSGRSTETLDGFIEAEIQSGVAGLPTVRLAEERKVKMLYLFRKTVSEDRQIELRRQFPVLYESEAVLLLALQ